MGEPSAQAHSLGETPLGPKLPLRLGRFTLCEELGAGGMATVYLARMEMAGGLERLAALKTIHPHLAKERAFVDMFLDEARIASHVGHPNVCATYDFGEVNGVFYLAMEYLLGEPLFDVINRLVECFDDAQEVLPYLAARIIADAAEGLHAAHTSRGPDGERLAIVHRDVSPQNLFLTYDGSVKVVDFGCAKAAERVAHTSTGVMKGKVGYAAPEQLKSDHVDARADIWALGVCLWETLTLSPLFSRSTAVGTAMAVLEEEVELASDGRAWVPETVALIADKALRRDRGERYESARDLSRDLRRFIADSGFTLESAEVAEWMDFLFEDRHEARVRQAARVRELDLSRVSVYEAMTGDVEREPLEALPVDEEESEPAELLDRSSSSPLTLGSTAQDPSGAEADVLTRAVSPKDPDASRPEAAANDGNDEDEGEDEDDADERVNNDRKWLIALAVLAFLVASGYVVQYYSRRPSPVVLTAPRSGWPGASRTGSTGSPSSRPPVDGVEEEERSATEPIDREEPSEPDRPAVDERPAGNASGELRGPTPSDARERGSTSRDRSPITTVASGRHRSAVESGASPVELAQGSGAGATGGPGETMEHGGIEPPLQSGSGILSLATSSGWAEVYAGGRSLGRTPIHAQLPGGRYRLRVLPYGEEPAMYLPIHVEAGVENNLVIDVDRRPGG